MNDNLPQETHLNSAKDENILENYKKTFLNFNELVISLIKTSHNIDIEVIQAGKGEPIVLLPPFDCNATVWRGQFLALSKDYQVISLHYPGVGRSGFDKDLLAIEDVSKLILEVLGIMKINQPIHWVGWSLGGLIAQYITDKWPNVVRTLTLVNSISRYLQKPLKHRKGRFVDMVLEDFNISQAGYNEKNKITLDQIRGGFSKEIRSFYNKIPIVNPHELNEMKAPFLIIIGGRDKIIPEKFSKKIKIKNDNAELCILESAGHYIPLFNPDYFNKKFLNFIKRIRK